MAHALTEKRWGLVRGIASQKDITHPPLFGNQAVESVRCSAHNLVWHILQPGFQQSGNIVWLHHGIIVFAGFEHKLPAAVVAPAGHYGSRTVGVTHHYRQLLNVTVIRQVRDRRKRNRPIHFCVNHEPGFFKLQVVQFDTQCFAHLTARAITGNDILSARCVFVTVTYEGQRYAGLSAVQINQFGTQIYVDIFETRKGIAQVIFQFRLIEKIIVRPAKRTRFTRRSHVAQYAVVGPNMKVAFGVAHVWQNGVM